MKYNRKQFIQSLSASGMALTLFPFSISGSIGTNELRNLLLRAGNSNSEKERAAILYGAFNLEGVSDEEKRILKQLLYVADRWANGYEKYANPGSEGNESHGYLCGFFSRTSKIDRFLLPQVDGRSDFFPIMAFYRGRMLIAQLIQNGGISQNPENRRIYVGEGNRLMRIAAMAFPDNTLAKIYKGESHPWKEIVEYDENAPAWANYQRMLLAKLKFIIHWWIDNRQISDGQFGGGWGDDVEMWRNFVPVLFAFDDPKAVQSMEKLFEGLYGLSRMQKGYTTHLNDVEHTSEEYADPITCMLHLQPENKIWEERALKVLELIENIWTGTNARGHLQFKSTWFNVEKVDEDVKRACDSPYHTRLMQPLMLIWLRTGNRRIGAIMKQWLTTWVEATFTEENGKPYGIVPAAIHWPDGKSSGTGENWWQPENYHTTLYDYPSRQDTMYEFFLQAFHMTKDEYFLKPLRFVSDKILEGVGKGPDSDYETGKLDWCIAKLKRIVPDSLIKYRMLTGDQSYDQILEENAGGYTRFIFNHDITELSQSLMEQIKSLSLPKEFYTSEVRWTDRLFAFARHYYNDIAENPIPNFNANFLFSSLTGNTGDFRVLPVFGVKWLTSPDNIAALTITNRTDEFEAHLYHFGKDLREMEMELYNLATGTYQFLIDDKPQSQVEISDRSRKIRFNLSPGRTVRLKIALA